MPAITAPDRPYIHLLAIMAAAKQKLWGAIPASADIISDARITWACRQGARKAKVTQFQPSNVAAGGTCVWCRGTMATCG
jgi:hypothetical protein